MLHVYKMSTAHTELWAWGMRHQIVLSFNYGLKHREEPSNHLPEVLSISGEKKDSLVLSVWDPITDGVFVLNLCIIEISKNRNELKSAEDKVEK